MKTSDKFSIVGFLSVIISLFLLDVDASTPEQFIYNQILGGFIVYGIIMTCIGAYLTKYDYPKLSQHSHDNVEVKP